MTVFVSVRNLEYLLTAFFQSMCTGVGYVLLGIANGLHAYLHYVHILSTAVAYFCVIADNNFLNDPHNLIYSWTLLMLISLYVPVQ